MNNVELRQKREDYGLVTIPDPDPNSEAEIVVQTSEVNNEAYEEGARYAYAVLSLYTLRGLWTLGRYLATRGICSYVQLFRGFVDFCRAQPDHPWTMFCEQSIRTLEHVQFSNSGALIHRVLHAEREAFDQLLEAFVSAQPFSREPVAQVLFEIDVINRPYVYRSTPIVAKQGRFRHLGVEVLPQGYRIDVPIAYAAYLEEFLNVSRLDGQSTRFDVGHRRSQMPFMPRKSLHEHFMYCQDVAHRMRELVPVWREQVSAAAAS
jgi:hypothetical protein